MQKKFLATGALAAALTIGSILPAAAAGQAADRATGDVVRALDADGTDVWSSTFDAHAPYDMVNGKVRPAKGTYSTANVNSDDQWSGTVTCAMSQEDGSFLFGGTIDDHSVARWGATDYSWFMIEVRDGETDTMKATVSVNASTHGPCYLSWPGWAHAWTVTDGNLVVHTTD